MQNHYRYIFERGSKKHLCPGCGKRCFVRYIDTEEGNYLPEHYGCCDRENKCGYYLNPYTDGYAKANREQGDYSEAEMNQYARAREAKRLTQPEPVFIPDEVFKRTLKNYEQNKFIQNLLNRVAYPFTAADVEKVISLYYLGTVSNGYRAGAVTFPFINLKGKNTAIQVKQFDTSNHTTGTDFLHSIIEKHYNRNKVAVPDWLVQYTKQDKRINSLFGEHLLNRYPLNTVALVEAPKTAIYGALYFGFPDLPDNFIWLAVYNKSSFNYNKLKMLRGRDVFVFPDLSKDGGTFAEWQQKANVIVKQLPGTRFTFSNLLEKFAPDTDRNEGNDLADFLIKLDWRNFRIDKSAEIPEQITSIAKPCEKSEESEAPKKPLILNSEQANDNDEVLPVFFGNRKKENWEFQIKELENFFSSTPLPQSIKLDKGEIIADVKSFTDGHIKIVKSNNGRRAYLPYLERLRDLKRIISEL